MDNIIEKAKSKLALAKLEVERWEKFISDYEELHGNSSRNAAYIDIVPQEKNIVVKSSVAPKPRRNNLIEKYKDLRVASMNECLSTAKDLIISRGKIETTSKFLELFAEKNFTAKPHSLAAYLSQSKDFVYDKASGGWSLKQSELQQLLG